MKERAYARLKMAVKVVCNERGGGDGVKSKIGSGTGGGRQRLWSTVGGCNFAVTVQRQSAEREGEVPDASKGSSSSSTTTA